MARTCKDDDGNCTAEKDSDGLVAQCVGSWAHDKHFYLERFIDFSWGVRKDYLAPKGDGGAGFADLFAGPGRARVDKPREFIDGSPLIAIKHTKAPFTKIVLSDIKKVNGDALRARTAGDGRVEVVDGDCNERIDEIVAKLPKWGLNLALVDPFGASGLSFETLRRLSRLRRMDLLIHFPMADFKRNFRTQDKEYFERFLGLDEPDWGVKIQRPGDVRLLVDVLKRQLRTLGYTRGNVLSPPVKSTKRVVLYHLIYASKHPKGDKIWADVTKTTPTGQKGLF